MLYFCRDFSLLISVFALILAVPLPVGAENSQINAASLLAVGQEQFQNQDYVASRTTLWKAYGRKADLSDTQKQVLSGLLGEVDQAIQGQVVGKAQCAVATESLKAENWEQAREGLTRIVDSPYLSPTLRAEARGQLAMVDMKLAAALATEANSDRSSAKPEAVLAASEKSDDLRFEEDGETAKAPKAPTPAKKIAKAPAKEVGPSVAQAKKIKVDILLTRGRDALNKNLPAKAVELFSRALQLDPGNKTARLELDKAQQLTARSSGATVLDEFIQRQHIEKQISEQEIQQSMRRSMELMVKPTSTDSFDAAEQAARRAKNILQNDKRLFSTSEYRRRQSKIENQLKWIRLKRDEFNKKSILKKIAQIDIENRARSVQVQLKRDQRISELTKRSRVLMNDNKFYQALQVMKQILDLDSNNTWALDNIYMLEKIIILQQQKKAGKTADLEAAKLSADVRFSTIPWFDLIRYPKDWKELTARRGRFGADQGGDSEEDRMLNQKLEARIKEFEFTDTAFSEIVEYFRESSGANIFVNWSALEIAGIEKDKTVSIKLQDISFRKVLELILSDVGGGETELAYAVNGGVIMISTRDALDRETQVTRVYDIKDLLVRIPNFVGPTVNLSNIGQQSGQGSGSGSGGGSGSSSGLYDDDEDSEEEGEDITQTKSELILSVRNMITDTIAPDSWRPEGEFGAISELHGNLVITQTSENHRKVRELISRLRESGTIQVAIEARFITVNTGFLSQIGVDLDFYFNLGSRIHGGLPPVLDPITGALVPVTGASTWQNQGYRPSPALRKFSPIGISQSSMGFADVMTQTTNVASGIGTSMGLFGGAPAMSIVGTFLDDVQVDFLIEATQAHQSTRTLTAPRLTLSNGQRAFVNITTSQAYISGVQQITGDNVTAGQPIISYAPTGTMLDVEATVSHDRRYVTLTLQPQITTLNLNSNGEISGTEVPSGGGGGTIFIGLPVVTVQTIRTTVTIPDGGTLLIGGQKLTGEVEREMGVPILSKLPIINRAFTNKGKLRDEETLLILIKPTIIISNEVELDPARRLEGPAFGAGLGGY